MSVSLDALHSSVQRLRRIVQPLDDATIVGSAYPSDWSIAQVMSHIGSGAVIHGRRLDDQISATATPDDFAPGVWDEWNAKAPRSQVDDALAADAALVGRLEAVGDDDRRRFSFPMGAKSFDFDGFVGLRLNEHAFHTWDIEVVLDDAATLPTSIAASVVDRLELVAGYTARPSGDFATLTVRTTDPERVFSLELTSGGATFQPTVGSGESADLEMPAEAFARLVYGRLDPSHTPDFAGDPAIVDRLRATFPGP